MFEFKLPDLGEGIHEGEILKWHVGPGDAIVEDESLVEVETDKAAVTLPSPRSGRVVSVTGKPGDVVKVGQVIAVIEDGSDVGRLTSDVPGQEAGRAAVRGPGAGPREPGSLEAKSGAPGNDPAVQTSDIGRQASDAPVPATPATRRLARELGVDLRQVPPTGKAGRVTSDDVRRFKAAEPSTVNRQPSTVGPGLSVARTSDVGRQASDVPEPPPWTPGASPLPLLDLDPLPDFALQGPVEIEPLRSIRRRTARRMVTSMTLIPHVAHLDEVDVTELEAFRRREKARREGRPGPRLTLLAFVVKAVAAALKRHPGFNASLDPFREQVVYKKFYHVGIAVDTGRGLVVPVVRDADRLCIAEISAAMDDLSRRARDGSIGVDDLRGGTFTVTNIGALGGTGFVPAINYPESAILGMGRVADKPVVRDGAIVIRTMLPLVLAFDHRIADGADAARFVNLVASWLTEPARMLAEA